MLPELLAPAGDWKNLRAALEAGADAVYFGVQGYNMRAGAKNFRLSDLPRIATTCHEREARCFLALNTLVLEGEATKVRKVLTAAKAARVDAVIASDLSVISVAAEIGLEVHASTQLSIANSEALIALHKLGVTRFVLARECSLDDIKKIRRSLRARLGAVKSGQIELEVFAHGAMCVSVSGRCFMSEYDTGKSANKGACTQPCRREYKIVAERGGQEWVLGQNYVMSPKDLCTIPFLEKVLETKVNSLKIEGRNRSPEYVATVIKAYREALDFYGTKRRTADWASRWEALKKELNERVATVYNRGFSSGFYCGKPVNEWTKTGGSEATHRKFLVGEVLNFFKKHSVAEILIQDQGFTVGDELLVEGHTTGFFTQKVESLRHEGQPVDRAEPRQNIGLQVSHQVRPGDKLYILKKV